MSSSSEMSLIVITPDRFDTVRRIVRALRKQSICDRLELVIVAPSVDCLDIDRVETKGFAAVQVVELGGSLCSTSVARSVGIRAATAPVIALTEDHCFPAADWAEKLLARHDEGWAGVGAVFGNANPATAVSWANFLVEYGDFAEPVAGGEASMIPGHNSSYKRHVLLGYGDRLPQMLEAETAMQWDLIAKGHHFYLEPEARSFHLNYSMLGRSLPLRFDGGRLFAANRARDWSVAKRALFTFASPLIPLVRFSRVVRTVHGLGRQIPLRTLPTAALLLLVDGVGEMVGYAAGAGSAMRKLSDGEFRRERFLREQDHWNPEMEAVPATR